MKALTSRRIFWLGAGLILLCNLVALGGVAYNRSGEPDSRLVLTEREFGNTYNVLNSRENSGLSLRLNWRLDNAGLADWLTATKLRELGFPLDGAEENWPGQLARQRHREFWLVLELDGPAYARVLARARAALTEAEQGLREDPASTERQATRDYQRSEFEQQRDKATRLYLMDAGVDELALRRLYPDRQRHALVRGRLKPYFYANTPGPSAFGASVDLAIEQINVPLAWREAFQGWEATTGSTRAVVAFGQRHEPWLVSVERLP
ncbi:MAG: DUF4824 family protein [Pseudomonas sp.]|uniref:DUF4824 family protein n=1 Tax=Pseudomonas sp. TaxID=306 RepID=UPI003394DA34